MGGGKQGAKSNRKLMRKLGVIISLGLVARSFIHDTYR